MKKLVIVIAGSLALAIPGILSANAAIFRIDCYLSRKRNIYTPILVYERQDLPAKIGLCVHVYGGTPVVTPLFGGRP